MNKPAADDSYIKTNKDGSATTFAGPDAVGLFRAATLWSGIGLYIASNGKIIPTRGLTISKMLAIATTYTGKPYKRTRAGQEQARADLKVWMDTMKAALPVIQDKP